MIQNQQTQLLMRKILSNSFLLLTLFLLFGSLKSFSQEIDYFRTKGLPKETIENKVKSYTIYENTSKDKLKKKKIMEFNEKGLLTKEISFALAYVDEYYYNENDRIERIISFDFKDGDLKMKENESEVLLLYNDSNSVKSIHDNISNKIITNYLYDSLNRVISVSEYDSDGDDWELNYTYENNYAGNLIVKQIGGECKLPQK